MDVLQALVRVYMMNKPTTHSFPHSEQGQALVDFARAMCDEHRYEDIARELDLIKEKQSTDGLPDPTLEGPSV
jgi:hypothetical protein